MNTLSKAEKSYIQSSLLSDPPLRADGRSLTDYRSVALETGVASLANGSARVSIGRNVHSGGGGTEVIAAVKLEVETVGDGEGVDGGRIACAVACSPAAYSHLSPGALEDLQNDMTSVLHSTISHQSLRPSNLTIIPGKKSWLLSLDVLVLSDAGNVYDAIFMATRAAFRDTKVPRTRSVEYEAKRPSAKGKEVEDVDVNMDQGASNFDIRQINGAADFELPDYWDEGEELESRDRWPICVTLNLLPSLHFLDATLQEEAAIPLRLHLLFAFPSSSPPVLQTCRQIGPGVTNLAQMRNLLKEGEKHAGELWKALESKLKDEDIRRTRKATERFVHRQ